MPTTATRARRYDLTLPETVAGFFTALGEHGRIINVGISSVTLYLQADHADLAALKRTLVARGYSPAFPVPGTNTPGGIPSYRWEFADLTYAGNDQGSILVPVTADLHHLLGVVTGLGEIPEGYAGEPVLPVTLTPEDADDLHQMLTEIETELTAWFGEPVRLTPTPENPRD